MPSAGKLRTFDTEEVTVADSSIGLTISKFIVSPPAQAATITVEDAQMRWLKDGTDPTSSAGHVANVGSVIYLDNPRDLWNFRAIRTGASSAAIRISYHR